jgi:hypothetical protein
LRSQSTNRRSVDAPEGLLGGAAWISGAGGSSARIPNGSQSVQGMAIDPDPDATP